MTLLTSCYRFRAHFVLVEFHSFDVPMVGVLLSSRIFLLINTISLVSVYRVYISLHVGSLQCMDLFEMDFFFAFKALPVAILFDTRRMQVSLTVVARDGFLVRVKYFSANTNWLQIWQVVISESVEPLPKEKNINLLKLVI